MNVSYKINNGKQEKTQESFRTIGLIYALKLFNEFSWEQVQNEISKRLEQDEIIEGYSSIILKNENGICLSISSFDKDIFECELSKEKFVIIKKFSKKINSSSKLISTEVEEIIQLFYKGNLEDINCLLDSSKNNSTFELGQNAKKIKAQSNQTSENELLSENKGIDKSISARVSKGLIVFSLFFAYFILFEVTDKTIGFTIMMLFCCLLMMAGGIGIWLTDLMKKND